MVRAFAMAALAVVTVGCMDRPKTCVVNDMNMYRTLFNECLDHIPKVTSTGVFTDWDEAIIECKRHANDLSKVTVVNTGASCLGVRDIEIKKW